MPKNTVMESAYSPNKVSPKPKPNARSKRAMRTGPGYRPGSIKNRKHDTTRRYR